MAILPIQVIPNLSFSRSENLLVSWLYIFIPTARSGSSQIFGLYHLRQVDLEFTVHSATSGGGLT